MIKRLFRHLKDTLQVLIGKKVAVAPKTAACKKIEFKNEKFSPEEKAFLATTSLEFIFAEFGEERVNAGGAEFDTESRLDPTLCSLKKYFPNAKFTVYSDFELHIEGVELKKVPIPVPDPEHPRTGHRSSVYYRMKGLLDSKADFKCAIDSDMQIVSSDIITLITLTKKFGICVPYNDRQLLRQDCKMSLDTVEITDESKGMGQSYNQTPMTLWKGDQRGERYYTKACELMKLKPARGSYIMWKAAWETGIYPYVLPKQFCVCVGNEGIGDEVILHVGHPKIAEYYNF